MQQPDGELPSPTVYRCDDGPWRAVIPETTLRSLAEAHQAVDTPWGVQAMARAAKLALDDHDADQRREKWVERAADELFVEGFDGRYHRALAIDWLRLQYDRALGTTTS